MSEHSFDPIPDSGILVRFVSVLDDPAIAEYYEMTAYPFCNESFALVFFESALKSDKKNLNIHYTQ